MKHAISALAALTKHSTVPGMQYLVTSPDRTVFEHAGGWADIARQQPMTSDTTLMAYSMSKTITAAAVLQLVEAGSVRLDDSISDYVRTPYGAGITIRQLITHTSGIPNPIPLSWIHPAATHASFKETEALEAVLRKHSRLSFKPGSRFGYSNIGYWLLGSIIETVTRQDFSTYVCERIFAKLQIQPDELGYRIPDAAHATGYLEKYSTINLLKRLFIAPQFIGNYTGKWLEIRPHYLNGPAFGGLVGTARALATFLQDQLRPASQLFAVPTRELFYTPQTLAAGTPIPMTLGWHTGNLNGVRFYFKEGGGGGFHCMMRLYPAAQIGTIVMTNATMYNVRSLLDEVDAAFLSKAN